ITITATLKGGGVFRTATEIELRPKKTGSAEDARYVPSTLPSKIIIPARAASARTAFTLHLARATAGAIVVGVGATFSGSTVKIPDVRVLIDRFTWDVDENNFLDSSDAILIGRHLDMGFPGPALVRGIHTTDDHEAVLANLRRGESVLNVGELPPPGPNATPEKKRKFANQTGRLLLRYFQGYRGERLVKGQDPRLDWATVETNIKAYMPRRFLGI
ncbi:MAG: hypothetical protein MPL62_13940, partial [Alphaproteobacteria bacterium]|nr:hypothetical protein [Alphaproteobacteria bacterium]